MEWIELRIFVSSEADRSRVEKALLSFGARGTAADESSVMVYFPASDAGLQKARQSIARLEAARDLGLVSTFKWEMSRVRDEDWKENWKAFFDPVEVGRSLLVLPTWREVPDYAARKLIVRLDPGMAFGTGHHPTTRLCLRLLDDYLRRQAVVADVGTGSGILSIAAALLGARRVAAVDIDETAVKVARANVALNRVEDVVSVQPGSIDQLTGQGPFDVVMMNILAEVVAELGPKARHMLNPGGFLIASGIMTSKESLVSQALKPPAYLLVRTLREQSWSAMVFQAMV